LTRIAIECCSAIVVLQESNIIHRDIAARNFLLTEFLKVKLSDFGMSKQLLVGNYYSVKSKENAIPVRWTAPEVLTKEKYSLESDRYSLGITLFEIFSKGKAPFSALSNKELLESLNQEKVPALEKPKFATEKQFEIIKQLVDVVAKNRPGMEATINGLKLEETKNKTTNEKKVIENDSPAENSYAFTTEKAVSSYVVAPSQTWMMLINEMLFCF